MPAERTSIVASVLRQRPLCIALIAAGAVHLGATAAGVPGWICPWKAATGLPCPGCGLTRASIWLVRGDIAGALKFHPFAPVAVIGIALVLAGAILPDASRDRLLSAMGRVDRGGWISAVLLVALVVYWAVRLVLDAGW